MESLIKTDEDVPPPVQSKELVTEDVMDNKKLSEPIYSPKASLQLYAEKQKVNVRNLSGGDYLDMLLGDEGKLGVEFVTSDNDEAYNYGKKYDFSYQQCEVFPDFDYEKLDKLKMREIEEDKKLNQELLASHSMLDMVDEEFREKEIDELEKRMALLSDVEDLPENTDLTVNLLPVGCDDFELLEPEEVKPSPEKKEKKRSLPQKVVSRVMIGFLIMFGLKKKRKAKKQADADKPQLQRGVARRFHRDELLAENFDSFSDESSEEELIVDETKLSKTVGSRFASDKIFPYGPELCAYEKEQEEKGKLQRNVGKRFTTKEMFPKGLEVALSPRDGDIEGGDYETA